VPCVETMKLLSARSTRRPTAPSVSAFPTRTRMAKLEARSRRFANMSWIRHGITRYNLVVPTPPTAPLNYELLSEGMCLLECLQYICLVCCGMLQNARINAAVRILAVRMFVCLYVSCSAPRIRSKATQP